MDAVQAITLDVEEINRSGVARTSWFTALKYSGSALLKRVEFLLSVAETLRRAARPRDSLAATRIARRLIPDHPGVTAALSEMSPANRPSSYRLGKDCEVILMSSPEALQDLEKSVRAHEPPSGACLALNRYRLGSITDDLSFVVIKCSRPVAFTRCSISGDGPLSDFVAPMQIEFSETLPLSVAHGLCRQVLPFLIDQAKAWGAPTILLGVPPGSPLGHDYPSTLARVLYCEETYSRLSVDLTQDVATIHRGVRDSYRPLISRMAREADLVPIRRVSEAIKHDLMALFNKSHPPLTAIFDYVMAEARKGGAGLFVGSVKNNWSGAIAVLYTGDSAIYTLGGYDGTKKMMGLGHWLVYEAMMAAKSKGLKKFFLTGWEGPKICCLQKGVPYSIPRKLDDIFFFKRGFCSQAETMPVLRIFA